MVSKVMYTIGVKGETKAFDRMIKKLETMDAKMANVLSSSKAAMGKVGKAFKAGGAQIEAVAKATAAAVKEAENKKIKATGRTVKAINLAAKRTRRIAKNQAASQAAFNASFGAYHAHMRKQTARTVKAMKLLQKRAAKKARAVGAAAKFEAAAVKEANDRIITANRRTLKAMKLVQVRAKKKAKVAAAAASLEAAAVEKSAQKKIRANARTLKAMKLVANRARKKAKAIEAASKREVTATRKAAGAKIAAMAATRASMSALTGDLRSANQAMRTTSRVGMLMAAAFAAAGVAVTRVSSQFESSLTRAATVATGTASTFDRNFSLMSKEAVRLANVTEHTAKDIGEAMNFMSMAGLSAAETIAAIPTVAKLATAANLGMAESADIVTNVMAGFGLTSENIAKKIHETTGTVATQSQVMKELSSTTKDTANTLVGVLTSSNVSLSQLAEALKIVGPVGKSLNVPLEDLAATVGMLGNSGIRGTEAGTGLKRALSALVDPSKEAATAMGTLGLKTDQITKPGGLPFLIAQLAGSQKAFKDAGKDAKFVALMFKVFGERAGPKMASLVEQGTAAFVKIRVEAEKAKDADLASIIEERQLATLSGAINVLGSNIRTLAKDIGDRLLQPAKDLVEDLKSAITYIRGMDSAVLDAVVSIGKMGFKISAAVVVIGTLLTAITGLGIGKLVFRKLGWSSALMGKGLARTSLLAFGMKEAFKSLFKLIGGMGRFVVGLVTLKFASLAGGMLTLRVAASQLRIALLALQASLGATVLLLGGAFVVAVAGAKWSVEALMGRTYDLAGALGGALVDSIKSLKMASVQLAAVVASLIAGLADSLSFLAQKSAEMLDEKGMKDQAQFMRRFAKTISDYSKFIQHSMDRARAVAEAGSLKNFTQDYALSLDFEFGDIDVGAFRELFNKRLAPVLKSQVDEINKALKDIGSAKTEKAREAAMESFDGLFRQALDRIDAVKNDFARRVGATLRDKGDPESRQAMVDAAIKWATSVLASRVAIIKESKDRKSSAHELSMTNELLAAEERSRLRQSLKARKASEGKALDSFNKFMLKLGRSAAAAAEPELKPILTAASSFVDAFRAQAINLKKTGISKAAQEAKMILVSKALREQLANQTAAFLAANVGIENFSYWMGRAEDIVTGVNGELKALRGTAGDTSKVFGQLFVAVTRELKNREKIKEAARDHAQALEAIRDIERDSARELRSLTDEYPASTKALEDYQDKLEGLASALGQEEIAKERLEALRSNTEDLNETTKALSRVKEALDRNTAAILGGKGEGGEGGEGSGDSGDTGISPRFLQSMLDASVADDSRAPDEIAIDYLLARGAPGTLKDYPVIPPAPEVMQLASLDLKFAEDIQLPELNLEEPSLKIEKLHLHLEDAGSLNLGIPAGGGADEGTIAQMAFADNLFDPDLTDAQKFAIAAIRNFGETLRSSAVTDLASISDLGERAEKAAAKQKEATASLKDFIEKYKKSVGFSVKFNKATQDLTGRFKDLDGEAHKLNTTWETVQPLNTDELIGDQVDGLFGSITEKIKKTTVDLGVGVSGGTEEMGMSLMKSMGDSVTSTLTSSVGGGLSGMGFALGAALGPEIGAAIGSYFPVIGTMFGGAVGEAIGPWVGAALGLAVETFFPMIGEKINELIDAMIQGVKSGYDMIFGQGKKAGDFVGGEVSEKLGDSRLGDAFKNMGAVTMPLLTAFAALGAAIVSVVSLIAMALILVLGDLGIALSAAGLAITALILAILGPIALIAMATAALGGFFLALVGKEATTQGDDYVSSQSKVKGALEASVDRIIVALDPLWDALMPLVGLFDYLVDVMMPLVNSFAGMGSMSSVLFQGFKMIAIGIAALMIVIAAFVTVLLQTMINVFGAFPSWAGNLMEAFGSALLGGLSLLLHGLALILDKIGFDDLAASMTTAATEAGVAATTIVPEIDDVVADIVAGLEGMMPDMDGMIAAFMALLNLTEEEARARAEDLAEREETETQMNESLTNVPSGFKVALHRFRAMDPSAGGIAGATGGRLIDMGVNDYFSRLENAVSNGSRNGLRGIMEGTSLAELGSDIERFVNTLLDPAEWGGILGEFGRSFEELLGEAGLMNDVMPPEDAFQALGPSGGGMAGRDALAGGASGGNTMNININELSIADASNPEQLAGMIAEKSTRSQMAQAGTPFQSFQSGDAWTNGGDRS